MGWSRREFLASAVATAGLAACGAGGSDSSTATTATTSPGAAPAGPASLSDVEHVVILMQENRSFDHYFGTRPGVRGFADPDVPTHADGRPIWYQDTDRHPDGFVLPYHLDTKSTSASCDYDPPHGWIPQHVFWDEGKLDNFARFGPGTMGYYTEADIPYLYALADAFTLCDHSFCSVIGPTTPNRMYAMTGTIDAGKTGGGPVWENFEGPYTFETYPERLQKAGITWRVYQQEDDFGDNPIEFFRNYQDIPTSDPLHDSGVLPRSADAFMRDVEADALPQVSWIVAPQLDSEHPSAGLPAAGIDFTARHLAALLANPKVWAKTVFILSYDENGGWFDHVPPPVPPPGTPDEFVDGVPIGLGFRVPTIVASPWSTGGRVDSGVYDHTSTLRFLETRFGVEVPNLSAWRRETCGDLVDTLDFDTTDTAVPDLPDTAAAVAAAAGCRDRPASEPPSPQVSPAQA